jgi:hypothetical protein
MSTHTLSKRPFIGMLAYVFAFVFLSQAPSDSSSSPVLRSGCLALVKRGPSRLGVRVTLSRNTRHILRPRFVTWVLPCSAIVYLFTPGDISFIFRPVYHRRRDCQNRSLPWPRTRIEARHAPSATAVARSRLPCCTLILTYNRAKAVFLFFAQEALRIFDTRLYTHIKPHCISHLPAYYVHHRYHYNVASYSRRNIISLIQRVLLSG